jgi:hypothetical protein
MTKERVKIMYNIDVDKLTWNPGHNGLYKWAALGVYTLYYDRPDGYYLVDDRTNCVHHWSVDLSRYERRSI